MNIDNDYRIKLVENIERRAIREAARQEAGRYTAAAGSYCAARCASLGGETLLCAAIARNGKVSDERLIPSLLLEKSPSRIADAALNIAADCAVSALIMAMRRDALPNLDADFRYYASAVICISDKLQACGVTLKGFYLTDGTVYENILPKIGDD